MAINAATIRAMKAAGLSDSQILDVIEKDAEARAEKARAANRERQARHRARNANNADNACNADNGVTDVINVTEAQPRARVVNTNLPTGDISYNPPIVPPSEETASRKASRAKPKTRFPVGWLPSDAERQAGAAVGMDTATFDREWTRFTDSHVSRGTVMASWPAAWRTWCGNFQRFNPQPRAGPQRLSRLAEIATQGITDDEPSDHDNLFAATGPNAGGNRHAGAVSERARTDAGGPVVDLRPTGSGWR